VSKPKAHSETIPTHLKEIINYPSWFHPMIVSILN
jgi:hypothetical protein